MFTGFFKKVVIADSLSIIVAHVYSQSSDITVGVAKVFGINLTQNFNRPFAATSVRELISCILFNPYFVRKVLC